MNELRNTFIVDAVNDLVIVVFHDESGLPSMTVSLKPEAARQMGARLLRSANDIERGQVSKKERKS